MGLSRRSLVTENEFLQLPESTNKTELVDGEVIVSPSPSVRHQVLVQRLMSALTDWSSTQDHAVFIGHAPLDVRFSPGRILQPDLFVILDEVSMSHEGPLDMVPAICIEVGSSNRVYDRVTKRFIYGEAGVKEFWFVEPSGTIERYSGAGLATVVTESEGDLKTPILPGLELTVPELFRELE